MTVVTETIGTEQRPALAERAVLMLAPYFPPVAGAGVFRSMRFANYLPEFGWRPLVLSIDPGRRKDDSLLQQLPDGLFVRRVLFDQEEEDSTPGAGNGSPAPPRRRPGLLERCKQTAGYRLLRHGWKLATETPDKYVRWNKPALVAALEIVASEQPQAIYSSGPPHSVHLLARELQRRTGLPWIADFRDPWARRPWGNKAENPWGQRLYPWYERRCVRCADRVILNTESMRREFVAAYPDVPPQRFVSLPNACDPALAETVAGLLARRSQPASASAVRLCHPGSLYRERDPRPLVRAVAALRREGLAVEFEQIGQCDPRFALKELSQQLGTADSIHVTPPVPHAEVLERMAAADILVLLQPRTPIQVPGKLFEMILFEKPILALCHEGGTAELVREYGLGQVADPDSPDQIAAVLREMVSAHRTAQRPTSSNTLARSAFDARTLTGTLAETLDVVASQA